MLNLAWLIPAASLVSFLLIVFVMRRDKEASGWVAIAGVGVGFVLSLLVLQESLAGGQANLNVSWLTLQPGTALPLGMRVDPLAAVMLVVVTSISLMVQVYSRGYMRIPGHDHGPAELDPGYSRFFAFLALFTFSMLGLVLANNLLTISPSCAKSNVPARIQTNRMPTRNPKSPKRVVTNAFLAASAGEGR